MDKQTADLLLRRTEDMRQRYADRLPPVCPVCASEEVQAEIADETAPGVIHQPHTCLNCHATWDVSWRQPAIEKINYGNDAELGAEQLQAKYDGLAGGPRRGEHPQYSVSNWRRHCLDGWTLDGYWTWVVAQIEKGGAN